MKRSGYRHTARKERRKVGQRLTCRAASNSRSDREPSRLAARANKARRSENQNVRQPWGPLRAGTARGPMSLMQSCRVWMWEARPPLDSRFDIVQAGGYGGGNVA